ncbi:MAG TPA: GNAT family protein [Longimicrobium sp.]|nr:GNAT family protein [Longimicrobium sp.]
MELRTERLLLREFVEDDWRAVLAYQDDPLYLRFNEGDRRGEAEAWLFVQRFVDWQAESPRSKWQLAITLPGTGEVIGNVGVRKPSPEARIAETGYELAPAHWGRGYATEAALALVGWGFAELGLHRVHAHCVAENDASVRVLRKLGMRPEGRLRQHEWMQGRWWDVLLFGVLAEEWGSGAPG